jgi:DNA polymerase III subunit beta
VKFRVDREQFADAVSWAGRTVPARPAQPLLSGLRLECTEAPDARLSITSFDYDVSGRVEISADVSDPGVTLVNGKLLVDIARALPNQPVDLDIDGTRLRLRCGRTAFELPTLPARDYPPLPTMPEASGHVPGSVLAEAVSQVAVAAERSGTLPFLTGVRIEVDGDQVTLAATDRYRLAVRTFRWTPVSEHFTAAALVPARTLADTAKSLAHADEVRLAFGTAGEGLLGIEGMDRRTTTRLLDGDFPKYRSLLPTSSPTVARVETAALAEAVKRVSLVAEASSAVKMMFVGGELELEAGSGDDASGRDTIACQLTGQPIDRVAFNPDYLLEGLSALNQPVTNLAFTSPSKPAVLTGAPGLEAPAADNYLYLLMPVRLPAAPVETADVRDPARV